MFDRTPWLAGGLFSLMCLVATSSGCHPADVPKVGIHAAGQAVKWSPEIAAAALKSASSAPRYVNGVTASQPQPGPPPAPQPPADPYAPNGAAGCQYQGAAYDGRPVYVCGGYPWVPDRTTGAWIPYTPDQAAPPPPR